MLGSGAEMGFSLFLPNSRFVKCSVPGVSPATVIGDVQDVLDTDGFHGALERRRRPPENRSGR